MWCRAVLPVAGLRQHCSAAACCWCFPIFQPSFCVSLSPQCLEYCLNPNITKLHVITVEWQHCITTTAKQKLLYFCDQDISVMVPQFCWIPAHTCLCTSMYFFHAQNWAGSGRCQATRSNNSRELKCGGAVEYTGPSSVATLEWPLEWGSLDQAGRGRVGGGWGGSPVVSTLDSLPVGTAAVTCHQPHNKWSQFLPAQILSKDNRY